MCSSCSAPFSYHKFCNNIFPCAYSGMIMLAVWSNLLAYLGVSLFLLILWVSYSEIHPRFLNCKLCNAHLNQTLPYFHRSSVSTNWFPHLYPLQSFPVPRETWIPSSIIQSCICSEVWQVSNINIMLFINSSKLFLYFSVIFIIKNSLVSCLITVDLIFNALSIVLVS